MEYCKLYGHRMVTMLTHKNTTLYKCRNCEKHHQTTVYNFQEIKRAKQRSIFE